MVQSTSKRNAKKYFNEALQKSDYYLDAQEITSFSFQGKVAKRIGIENKATKDVFYALVENIHPITGETLTSRTVKNRTIGYDINFHCPKSVSILHVLNKDNHILDVFQEAVKDTMNEIEKDMKARVRKNGQDENRVTGELLWADFIHQTARPVKKYAPDPHLHCHCFTFNVTYDKEEKQFKAGQFKDIKRDMPYYQAQFHKNLSDKLIDLGYRIRRTKTSFEVEGVPQDVINLFSKRTNEIGRIAQEKNITNAKELDKLGSLTRAKKQKGLTMSQLKQDWRKQIKALGMNNNKAKGIIIRDNRRKDPSSLSAKHVIDYATDHCFERFSVMQDKRVLATAYRYAMGTSSVTLDHINDHFRRDSKIIKVTEDNDCYCTTTDVISEEKRLVALCNKGKNRFNALYKKLPFIKAEGQAAYAIEHILTNTNQITIIEGRAGTGKTTMMKEAVQLIEQTGNNVFVVAPTSQASRNVLKEEGFANAETVAKFLTDKKMQQHIKNGVLWVDEAGLLGIRDMTSLLQVVTEQNARLILSGDTRQHASVDRGDALRFVNILAGIPSFEINKIHRQRNRYYREAVYALSSGNAKQTFGILNDMNAIKEVTETNPHKAIIEDYLSAIWKGKSAVLISPTHKQGEELTQQLRKKLKDIGKIDKKDTEVKRLINLNMTDAEKSDVRHYEKGYVLQFNQNVKNIKRGDRYTVKAIKSSCLELINNKGETIDFALERKNKFDVFMESSLDLARGDLVRVIRNGFDANNKRLNNGQEFEVRCFKKDKILLRNVASKAEYTISKNFGHLTHAYSVTSYASQGKTVDEVFIYQPSATFPASDLKQFYVSVSRGRDSATIYTDDKEALLSQISKMRSRKSAMELLKSEADHLNSSNAKALKSQYRREPRYTP